MRAAEPVDGLKFVLMSQESIDRLGPELWDDGAPIYDGLPVRADNLLPYGQVVYPVGHDSDDGRRRLARLAVIERLKHLDPVRREAALAKLAELGNDQVTRASVYLKDPERFCREVLGGLEWSETQRRLAADVVAKLNSPAPGRILAIGGNGTGKSHILYDMVVWIWYMEWVKWKLRERRGNHAEPDGVQIILTAPSRENLETTAYYGLVQRGEIAAKAGHPLPGWEPRRKEGYKGASTRSVSWDDGPWRMLAKAPAEKAGGDTSHTAAGIHGKGIQIILAEEASGLGPGMLNAITGLSVAGNVLTLAGCNPTSTATILYGLYAADPDSWSLFSFSQLDHPNVILRREVIPGGVSHYSLEGALRSASFEDRGPWPETVLDPTRLDVIYALPPKGMPDEPGPRPDGHPGHPKAQLRVFRPMSDMVAGQRLGGWLEADAGALLFHVAQIATRMASGAWREPDGPPDQVGVDCAQSRPPVACPMWGPTARHALDSEAKESSIHCGKPRELEWSGLDANAKAMCSARAVVAIWGKRCKYVVDRAFGGELGMALASMKCDVVYVEFGSKPSNQPLDLYGPARNKRAEMHLEAAAAINAGIVALPFVQRLLDQMKATGSLLVATNGTKVLREKKEIEAILGYSPDDLDSLCLALTGGGSFLGFY